MPLYRFESRLARLLPLAGAAALAVPGAVRSDEVSAALRSFEEQIEPLLAKYCYDCHGDGMDSGDFRMDDYEKLEDHLADLPLWFEIWESVRASLMPPAKKTKPEDEEKALLLGWIERKIFQLDPDNPDPGAVTLRRLNREEYRNTIQDLLGVRFNVDEAFPPDDTGYGFDTIGDVLSISPLLMEKYVEAAAEVVSMAVPQDGPRIPVQGLPLDAFKDEKHDGHSLNWMPFQNQRVLSGKPWVNHSGEHEIRVELAVKGSDEASSHSGTLALLSGDQVVAERHLSWDNSSSITLTGKITLERGRENEISFSMAPGSPAGEGEKHLAAQVQRVTIRGPLDGSVKEYPREFLALFFDGPPPEDQAARGEYRREILRRVATRAFRRPVDDPTLDRLAALAASAESGAEHGFEKGVGHALTAILASPRFLFRAEVQPEPDNPGKIVPVDEYALASRLSYFLWSSCPDDELLALAGEGKLRENLRAQVDRLLADAKSERFVRNFTGQWLQARDVETMNFDARRILSADTRAEAAEQFNGQLRQAMRQETEFFFTHILRENRPATELLTASYTFLNERLAQWYGIEGVKGNEMRLVELKPESRRGGLLTQSTFLMVTSNPTRTSPVKRGLFVLENLLATPSPPAVPDVPPLEESQKGDRRNLPLREVLKIHSEQALCASCHERMDPIGLALENFNALGGWRDEYQGQPIDASGQLVTGESFNGPRELALALAESRRADFLRALAEKLLTYAIGRGVEYYDAHSIDAIIRSAEANGGTLQAMIHGIIDSPPFQKRRGDGDLFASE